MRSFIEDSWPARSALASRLRSCSAARSARAIKASSFAASYAGAAGWPFPERSAEPLGGACFLKFGSVIILESPKKVRRRLPVAL